MPLIDSHCHLDFTEFDADRKQILAHCRQLDIQAIIVPATMADRWQHLLSVCSQSDMLYPALGLHPLFLMQHSPDDLIKLTELIAHMPLVAIGEIGLDFYNRDLDKTQQINLFQQQLEIAQHVDLPVLLHVRKAHDHTIRLLKKHSVKGGIVHAFNGSLEQAREYQKLGFSFGAGGALTYPRASRLRALFTALPLSSLVLETDAPDMPLYKQKQTRNTPENIPLILNELANLKKVSPQKIAEITNQNCKQIFNLA